MFTIFTTLHKSSIKQVLSISAFMDSIKNKNDNYKNILPDIKNMYEEYIRITPSKLRTDLAEADIVYSISKLSSYLLEEDQNDFIHECIGSIVNISESGIDNRYELYNALTMLRFGSPFEISDFKISEIIDLLENSSNRIFVCSIIRFMMNFFLLKDIDQWNQEHVDYVTEKLNNMSIEEENALIEFINRVHG